MKRSILNSQFSILNSQLVLLALGAWLAAWLATQAAGPPRCVVGAEDDLGCARGFETRERDGARPFRWTDERAGVVLAGLGYGAQAAIELTLAAPRPPGDPPVGVVLSVGGRSGGLLATPAPRRYRLLLPAGFPSGDRAEITVTSATFTPEGGARSLGAMVYEARALPLGAARLPGPLLVLALLGLGLAASITVQPAPAAHTEVAQRTRPCDRLPALAGLIVIAAAAALWWRLPARVAPFLPALALLAGCAALAGRRTHGFALLRRPAVLTAVLTGAALDGAIVGGALRGPWITLALALQATLTVWAIWCVTAREGEGERRGEGERGRGGDLPISNLHPPSSILHPPSSILHPPSSVLLVALAVRLLAFADRLLAARGANDPDVELFYSYGRATLELGAPVVEYPSGALLPWAIMALPASRELFALLLPLLNLACDLAIVWGIWTIGEPRTENREPRTENREPRTDRPPTVGEGERGRGGEGEQEVILHASRITHHASRITHHASRITSHGQLALFYALSPLLLPFWHGKYDSLPAALLVLGLAAFASGRAGWAGAALGLGGAIKWVPWLAAPFLAWELLRPPGDARPRWGALARLCGALIGVVVAVSLPFALRDPQTFLVPYTLQGSRQIIGESIWFPATLLINPGLLGALAAPWEGVADAPISPRATVAAQALALGALALAQIARPRERGRTVALAALAPAVFLLLNRVFSPQYLLVITACLLSAGALVLRARAAMTLICALALMQAANLLVWPNTDPSWLLASIVMFTLSVGVVTWLAVRALHQPPTADRRPPTAGSLNEEARVESVVVSEP